MLDFSLPLVAAICRALAYVNAFTDIVLALGWGCDVQGWLCKPDGAQ